MVVLLCALIVAVVGLGVVVWRNDQHAADRADELACLQRVDTLASIAALVPAERIDVERRLELIQGLGDDVDAC